MARVRDCVAPWALVTAVAVLSMVTPAGAATIDHTDSATFVAALGDLTTLNFDVDGEGNAISGPVLALDQYADVVFDAGVIFAPPNLTPASSPNILGHTAIDGRPGAGSIAPVMGRFTGGVSGVGITNVGDEARLSVFDANGVQLASLVSAGDFLGFTSDTPIHRFEYEIASGTFFGGDDLMFAQTLAPDPDPDPEPTPEPTALAMTALTLGALAGRSRRRPQGRSAPV